MGGNRAYGAELKMILAAILASERELEQHF